MLVLSDPAARSFNGEDPFPNQTKSCQCLMPQRDEDERVLYWQWCANQGGECSCDSAARFGNSGDPGVYEAGWFTRHPEVGPGRWCSPRQPPPFRPSFLELQCHPMT